MPGIASYLLDRLGRIGSRCLLRGNATCARPEWTARDVIDAVDELAAGLVELGVRRGDHVGLVADNCDLWLVADLACLSLGAVDVPRAGDCSVEEVLFVLEHAECSLVILEDQAQLDRLQPRLGQLVAVRQVVVLKGDEGAVPTFASLATRGRAALAADPALVARARAAVGEDDLATVVYTSGTTGNPKGVMLTHGNILHNVRYLPDAMGFRETDDYLSFLPTWHMFERTVEYCLLVAGATIHYSNRVTLKRDLVRVRPTIAAGVPRIWESIANAVTGRLARGSAALRVAVQVLFAVSRTHRRLRRLEAGVAADGDHRLRRPSRWSRPLLRLAAAVLWPTHAAAGRLVYAKVAAALGGRIRFLVSGGGALPTHVDEFFDRAGIMLLNGYGLTETAPVICVRFPDRNVLGTAGRPLPMTDWRVTDETGERDLGRLVKGVLWVRGPQVMQGYFKNPSATGAVLRAGWFCTGDLAALTDENDVLIQGRVKDTIVLRGGENVEPEVIEAELMRSPLIRDVIIVGHGQKHLAALVVPEPEGLEAAFPGLAQASLTAVAAHPAVGRLLHREMGRVLGAERGFRVFERVPRIACLSEGFSVEQDTLTRTMKKRRPAIEDLYRSEIEALFREGAPEVILALGRGPTPN